MSYTYRELGLPSIGQFLVSAMRGHRNPIVSALGALLESRANYLPGDRWEVASIRTMADYTRSRGQPRRGAIDVSLIEIGEMTGYHATLTHERFLPSGARGLPLMRLFIPSREQALERMIRRRYGRRQLQRMLPHFRRQHMTFSL